MFGVDINWSDKDDEKYKPIYPDLAQIGVSIPIKDMTNIQTCEHVFSFEEGAGYEAWLNYEPKLPKELGYCGVIFKYCPLCGEELIIQEVELD